MGEQLLWHPFLDAMTVGEETRDKLHGYPSR
jgi:hypothetical protein